MKEAQTILNERIVEEFSLPDSHRETDVLLSLIYSMVGEVDLAMESALKGIQLGEKEKSGFVEAVGWIRMGHAKILEDPFDLHVPENILPSSD